MHFLTIKHCFGPKKHFLPKAFQKAHKSQQILNSRQKKPMLGLKIFVRTSSATLTLGNVL